MTLAFVVPMPPPLPGPHDFSTAIASRLTPRQHQLAALLCEKRSIVDAARELGISVGTARGYVKQIALRLPNPHGISPLALIRSYADHIRRVR